MGFAFVARLGLGVLLLSSWLALDASTVHAGQWIPIGPNGASVTSVAIDPITPSNLYAAAAGLTTPDANGGMFSSTNGGSTWTFSTNLGEQPVRKVAVDPITPSIVWILTLENVGGDLLKSIDGGATWTPINVGVSPGVVSHIELHPTTSGVAYAAVDARILKTINGGSSWSVVREPTMGPVFGVYALGVDPGVPSHVFACVSGSDGFVDLVKSTDDGGSWSDVTPSVFGSDGAVATHIAFDSTTPGTVYAGGQRLIAGLPFAAVYVSIDDGATWNGAHPVSDQPVHGLVVDQTSGAVYALSSVDIWKSTTGGSSWSALPARPNQGAANSLAIDPSSSTTLYAGMPAVGVARSVDGGSTWTVLNEGMEQSQISAIDADPINAGGLLAKYGGGPAVVTANSGGTWTTSSGVPADSEIFQEALKYDPTNSGRIYAALESVGVGLALGGGNVRKSTDGGLTFNASATETAFLYSLAVDPFDPDVIYAGSLLGNITCEPRLWRSDDQGVTYDEVFIGDFGCEVRTVAPDPVTPGRTYVGVGPNGSEEVGWLYRNAVDPTSGDDWEFLNLDRDVDQIRVDPVNPANVYLRASTQQISGMMKSTNASTTFAHANNGLPLYPSVVGSFPKLTALAMDSANPSTLYAADDNGVVYRTTDGAGQWDAFGSLPPNLTINAIVVDPLDSSRVYVATREKGVFLNVPECGDGIAEGDELCDDGNASNADCCSTSCAPLNEGVGCSDGDFCTMGDSCTAGVCASGAAVVCALCEQCDPLDGSCVGAPRDDCKASLGVGKSKLMIKDKSPDSGDSVVWKWGSGDTTQESDLGTPNTSTDYALCMYEGPTEAPLFKSVLPAGGTCGTKPCWKGPDEKGVKYGDKEATPDGAQKTQVKAGISGKAKASFKGGGTNLATSTYGMPMTPLAAPVLVQLQVEGGACFESTFSTWTANADGSFKAKSD